MKYILFTLLVLYIGGTTISFSDNKDHDHIWVTTTVDTIIEHRGNGSFTESGVYYIPSEYGNTGEIVCILCKEKKQQVVHRPWVKTESRRWSEPSEYITPGVFTLPSLEYRIVPDSISKKWNKIDSTLKEALKVK